VPADLLYKVAYDEAVRALSEQQAAIDSFHSRVGLLFSAAAITTSFLGAQALRAGPSFFSWLALLDFVGVAVILLAILWPRKWEAAVNPDDVIETYIESEVPAPVEDLYRDLSFHMGRSHLENRKGLEKLVVFFQIANVLLGIEVMLWITAIAFAS
jgi:hypothetical protein